MGVNYLIIGPGYIGGYLAEHLPCAKLVGGYIHNPEELKQLLNEYPGHVLINCAGKTGKPNVDWCEDHKDQTFGGNVGIPVMIAEACQELKRHWIHIGSGCVYEGYDKEFTEEDPPNFRGNFYSKTKLWSQTILEGYKEACILRIRMPINEHLGERNYISKVVKYAKAGLPLMSKLNSMTVLKDLVDVIKFLAERGETGTWNVVNKGPMDISEIMELYNRYVEPDHRILYNICDTEAVQRTLRARRSNCVLSINKLEQAGFNMPELHLAVESILDTYGKTKRAEEVL